MGEILCTSTALQAYCQPLRNAGKKLAWVPTMGGLHAGHLALVDRAVACSDHVLASIFVNPTQFDNIDDFKQYPRREQQDCTLLFQQGASAVFVPQTDTVYPPGETHEMQIPLDFRVNELCGKCRPGHFEGVLNVASRLLKLLMPDVLVLGEKDYQQLVLIRQLVRWLDLPVTVEGVATVREASGLACSSRNEYLSREEREQIAPKLYKVLSQFAQYIRQGMLVEQAHNKSIAQLEEYGFAVEYLELRSPQDLLPVQNGTKGIALAAVRLGETHLIDNVAV